MDRHCHPGFGLTSTPCANSANSALDETGFQRSEWRIHFMNQPAIYEENYVNFIYNKQLALTIMTNI
jgi:hypothetical protein